MKETYQMAFRIEHCHKTDDEMIHKPDLMFREILSYIHTNIHNLYTDPIFSCKRN